MRKYKSTLYIAYGSNLNLPQMAVRCPTAEVVGQTELQGYDLKFRGGDGFAVATIEPGEGAVPVLLWQIGPQDRAALDRYEGYPRLYRQETLAVELHGEKAEAMVYIMNDGRKLGEPSASYFNTIMDGYESAGFNKDVLHDALERSRPEIAQEPLLDPDW